MKKTILFLLLLLPILNFGQSGTIDLSFNNVGTGLDGQVNASVLQPDGKIIVVGAFTYYDPNSLTSRNRVARLNSDGSLDYTFNPGTGANSAVRSVCLQPDGKIIIAGNFTSFNNNSNYKYIARLNSNGSLDNTFNLTGTGFDNSIYTVSIQSTGKIIVGGFFNNYNGNANSDYFIRLNSNGTFDDSFNVSGTVSGSGAQYYVFNTKIQSDDKIIIVGIFNNYNGVARKSIARVNSDGSLDTSFNPGTGLTLSSNTFLSAIAIEQNGSIIIGGAFNKYDDTNRPGIARLNSNGTLDLSTFNATSMLFYGSPYFQTICLENDGKIIVGIGVGGGGTLRTEYGSGTLFRLDNNGDFDSSFICSTSAVLSSLIQPDGKIIIAGSFDSCNGVSRSKIARINSASIGDVYNNVDLTFNNSGTGLDNAIFTSALQLDGKIIVGGSFTNYNISNTVSRNYIARLKSDGLIDTTFDPGSGFNGNVQTVALQPNGKVLVGGYFTSFNGFSTNRIARLNTDGSLDTSFSITSGADAEIFSIILQPNGKIIVAGNFLTFNGDTTKKYICRLNTDGSIDTSFNTIGIGLDSNIRTVSLQSDGKIIIAGYFSNYNGISRNKLARLNSDGSLDTSFDVGIGPDGLVRTSAIDSNGKILIGGDFSNVNGVVRYRLARFNSNGTFDNSYNNNPGPVYPFSSPGNATIYNILIQPDDRVLLGGNFGPYGTGGNLNFMGLDFTCVFDGNIYTILYQPNGNVIVGGNFSSFNGVGRNKIVRIIINSPLSVENFVKEEVIMYPNPAKDHITIDFGNNANIEGYHVEIFNSLGQILLNQSIDNQQYNVALNSWTGNGMYFVKVYDAQNNLLTTRKIILQ
jgi:uncharacterized delta-60 repeat protein